MKTGIDIGAYRIRQARRADAAVLPDIERSAGKAFRQIPDLAWIADDGVQSADRHLQLIAGGAAWVAADTGDRPVGFMSAEQADGNLHIWELAVDDNHQRRGIGRRLIERARGWAGERDLSALTLTTFRDVPWNEPFYRSLGFTIVLPEQLTDMLRDVLRHEAEAGLPPERRCAMRYPLTGQ